MELIQKDLDFVSPGNLGPLAAIRPIFWAQLTSYDASLKTYAWKEQRLSAITGIFDDAPGGRFGTLMKNPAVDANENVLTTPIFVVLQLGYFDPGGRDWVYLIIAC